MLLPVLAGLGALSLMSNPRRRRRKARRRNPSTPGGTDSRGTRYKLRKNTETAEWMLVAYVNGKRHEGRTLYFPFDRYDRASVADARKDAENTLAHVTGARANPHYAVVMRRGKGATKVKNLGWLLSHWRDVAHFTVTPYHGSRREMIDAVLTARMRDGTRYRSTYASKSILWSWLQRPVFRGLPLRWFGRDMVIEKRATLPNPRRRGRRRNPGTISRTSLTDAEAAIGGKALLGSKRSGAWAMSHASAKTFANRLRHGFKVVPSSHAGHDGKQLYLVTDGHWYVG